MLSTDSGGVPGSWFSNRMPKVVGNGIYTLFWFDLWVIREIFMDTQAIFLVYLSINKQAFVEDMLNVSGGLGYMDRRLHKNIFIWEDNLVGECRDSLANISLH